MDFTHNVQFVSQLNRKHSRYGCGAASLMMILKHHRLPIQCPKYQELCQCLWLNVEPEKKGYDNRYGWGVYFTDFQRALEGLSNRFKDKIKFNMIESPWATAYKSIKRNIKHSPIIAAVSGREFGPQGHWIVLIGNGKYGISYLDPNKKAKAIMVMSPEHLGRRWDNYGLFLNHRKHACLCKKA